MNEMLTLKEVEYISDLLIYEESAYKKAKLYSKIMTDRKLAEKFTKLSENHKKRYTALLQLL